MQRTNAQSIGKIITALMQKRPDLANKLVETRLINYWTDYLHSSIKQYTSKIFIKNRILYVRIDSSILKNELMMCRDKLIIFLDKKIGIKIIDQIIFI